MVSGPLGGSLLPVRNWEAWQKARFEKGLPSFFQPILFDFSQCGEGFPDFSLEAFCQSVWVNGWHHIQKSIDKFNSTMGPANACEPWVSKCWGWLHSDLKNTSLCLVQSLKVMGAALPYKHKASWWRVNGKVGYTATPLIDVLKREILVPNWYWYWYWCQQQHPKMKGTTDLHFHSQFIIWGYIPTLRFPFIQTLYNSYSSF